MQCELCERETDELVTHELVPRSRMKKKRPLETVQLCPDCDHQLHSLFTKTQLATDLASIEAMRDHPAIAKFLTWIKKQDPSRRVKMR